VRDAVLDTFDDRLRAFWRERAGVLDKRAG
jgi:hypothetical protein